MSGTRASSRCRRAPATTSFFRRSPKCCAECGSLWRRGNGPVTHEELYETACREFSRALDRLAAGYEADREKRHDLRQEIHLQLWRSFEVFDGRCSLKTWTFRVAHNT